MSAVAEVVSLGGVPRARIGLSVLLGAVTVLAGVGLMGTAGYVISRAAEHPPVLSLTVAIVAVRAFALTRPVSRYLERLVSHDLAFRVLARIRVAFYRRLEPLVPARAGGQRSGDLLAAMVADVDAMQNLFLRGLTPVLVAVVAGGISIAALAGFVPLAALVLFAGLLFGGVVVPGLAARSTRSTAERQVALRTELTAELVEVLRAAPELVVFGADEAAADRVRALDSELLTLRLRDAAWGGAVEGLSVLVSGLTAVGVLAACVSAAASGHLNRVLIAALTFASIAAFEAVAPLPAAAASAYGTRAAAARLAEVANRRPAVVDPVQPRPASGGRTARLDAVTFHYPRTGSEPGSSGEGWELTGVDLALEPGRTVVLAGPSGAGKSTVAALLVRFIDPDSGQVTVGDPPVDLRDLEQVQVRRAIVLDGQDSYLFDTSIAENVRLARPGAEDADVEAALRRARAWGWVDALPAGMDTLVGAGGANVSGGERRRIALARTFLADADVLVLDEPTAHLDPETAREVLADVLAATDGGTVLVITHRDEGVEAADLVVTLLHGRIEVDVP